MNLNMQFRFIFANLPFQFQWIKNKKKGKKYEMWNVRLCKDGDARELKNKASKWMENWEIWNAWNEMDKKKCTYTLNGNNIHVRCARDGCYGFHFLKEKLTSGRMHFFFAGPLSILSVNNILDRNLANFKIATCNILLQQYGINVFDTMYKSFKFWTEFLFFFQNEIVILLQTRSNCVEK